jgi:hypothetical protein
MLVIYPHWGQSLWTSVQALIPQRGALCGSVEDLRRVRRGVLRSELKGRLCGCLVSATDQTTWNVLHVLAKPGQGAA